jgi:hypothetical protein
MLECRRSSSLLLLLRVRPSVRPSARLTYSIRGSQSEISESSNTNVALFDKFGFLCCVCNLVKHNYNLFQVRFWLIDLATLNCWRICLLVCSEGGVGRKSPPKEGLRHPEVRQNESYQKTSRMITFLPLGRMEGEHCQNGK